MLLPIKTFDVPSYNDLEAEVTRLRAEVTRLRAELEKTKATKRKFVQLVFGERVFAELKRRNWKTKDLAAKAGINDRTLKHIQDGTRALKLPDAAAVADALEVSLDWLCGREV